MSFNNIIQPPRVGPKITNSLGFIRKDICASYIDAVDIQTLAGNCCCPELKSYCLALPCDFVGSSCQCLTMPLIDTKTGEPFLISTGTLLDKIIINVCPGVCLDDGLEFILGAMTTDADPAAQNRWISESNQVTGALLNCSRMINLDAAARCRNVALEACKTKCGGTAGPTLCSAEDTCPSNCGAGGRCVNCPTTPPVGSDDCCFGYPGPCPVLRFGELENSLLGITVCKGTLYQTDLKFTIQVWELAGESAGAECSDCAGPNYAF